MLQRGFPLSGINFDSPGATGKKSPRQKARRFFGAPAGISPIGDELRLPGSSRKKILPPKGERIFLVLQRGFPLSGINFDSPGATGKKSPRQKARRFFGAPAGISPIGDELRLPGSSRKKILPPKGERIFLVLQRGFPLSGMNFDSPGAAGKKFSRRKAREFFWCSSGDSNPGHPA